MKTTVPTLAPKVYKEDNFWAIGSPTVDSKQLEYGVRDGSYGSKLGMIWLNMRLQKVGMWT